MSLATAARSRASAGDEEMARMVETMQLIEQASQRIASVFDEIVESTGAASEIVSQIADASRDQADSIETLTAGLDSVDRETQGTSESASTLTEISERLSAQTEQLEASLSHFETE